MMEMEMNGEKIEFTIQVHNDIIHRKSLIQSLVENKTVIP